jgi:hypothetical protein
VERESKKITSIEPILHSVNVTKVEVELEALEEETPKAELESKTLANTLKIKKNLMFGPARRGQPATHRESRFIPQKA